MDEYRAREEQAVGRSISDAEWERHWGSRWNIAYGGAQLADSLDDFMESLPDPIRRLFKGKK